MAGENASTSSQMRSSKWRAESRQSEMRELTFKNGEVLGQIPLCRSPPASMEYEGAFHDSDSRLQNMMPNLSSRRHSNLSLHSSSSSGESRPTSSSRKKAENHSSYQSTGQMRQRQSISISSRANSEESPDELSPRQMTGKSLSKYKPLPAIRGKNPDSLSPDILRIPTDCETEETFTKPPQMNSAFQNLARALRKQSPRPSDKEHLQQVNQQLTNVHLDQKGSLTDKIQPNRNNDELLSLEIRPSNSISRSDISVSTDFLVEPTPDEPRTLLAVKLPSGQRIERFFRLTAPLWRVRQFAEISSGTDFADYQLVKSVPREILDLQLTIKENNLLERTLLHLEIGQR